MFAVGDKVVYPMHGAGVVKTIEKRERDGQSVDYLILAMLLGEMKVMVPVDSVERVGLRHVIENDDIDAVEKVLEERPDNYNKAITWNRRFNMYLEKMKSASEIENDVQVSQNDKIVTLSTCTGNDNIHACPNGSLHIVLIMMGCDHHIDTQKTSAPADCSGFGCFLIYCFNVAGKGVLPEIFFAISRMCRRNHTHAAFLHDSTGKISQRNTNSHAALNNRLFQIL